MYKRQGMNAARQLKEIARRVKDLLYIKDCAFSEVSAKMCIRDRLYIYWNSGTNRSLVTPPMINAQIIETPDTRS